jgi:hypothetical protein
MLSPACHGEPSTDKKIPASVVTSCSGIRNSRSMKFHYHERLAQTLPPHEKNFVSIDVLFDGAAVV